MSVKLKRGIQVSVKPVAHSEMTMEHVAERIPKARLKGTADAAALVLCWDALQEAKIEVARYVNREREAQQLLQRLQEQESSETTSDRVSDLGGLAAYEAGVYDDE
jgi:hypothetical protein